MHLAELIHQKSYEKVLYKIRRHPITFIPILLLFFVLLLVPVLLYFLISSLFPQLLTGPVSLPLIILLASVYYLSVYLFFYVHFLDFYLDLWIITNDRIIDIEQFGLFSRSVTELDLFRIQDITVDMHGFFATVFNYGNISVKTASSTSHIVFYNVGTPNKIRQDLIQFSEKDRKYHKNET